MNATITKGYVMVETTLKDCEGVTRTIDLPYVGRTLYGKPNYHPSCKPYVRDAIKAAKKALKSA